MSVQVKITVNDEELKGLQELVDIGGPGEAISLLDHLITQVEDKKQMLNSDDAEEILQEKIREKLAIKEEARRKQVVYLMDKFIEEYTERYTEGTFHLENKYLIPEIKKFCEEKNIHWERGTSHEYGMYDATFTIYQSKEELEKAGVRRKIKKTVSSIIKFVSMAFIIHTFIILMRR